MQQLQIPYGSNITLKSKHTQKYLGFKHQAQTVAAHFFHPRIHNNLPKNEAFDISLKLKILPRQPEKMQDRSQLVTEGARVFLVTANTDEYLTSTSKMELKFDKKSLNEDMNKMMFKAATWTVSYASTQKSLSSPTRNPISPFDAIVLKSVLGNYLTVQPTTSDCLAQLQMDQQRSVWFIELADERRYPQWVYQRPTFSKFLVPQQSDGVVMERRALRSNPPELQQALLVEDILDVSFGFEGTYIKRRPGSCLFAIQPHIPSTNNSSIALYQLTYRILELTSHYEKLMGFIKKLEISEGVLVQALGDGLRKIAAQYYQEIVQLDQLASQGLTLQKMWVEIQDSLKVMKALGDLVTSARDLKGGQLLSCLQKLINQTTDGFVLNIYKHILERLISIYVGMLSKWIYEGIVDDKYGQFIIKVEEKASGEWNNWEERFTLRTQQIPTLLERDQQKILVTGKYLNILKACNRKISCPFAKDIQQNIEYHISRQNFTEPIQRAYQWANQQLLQLVFGEYKLVEILTSLKGYYFLHFGDLFVHFLDAAQQDLFRQKTTKLDTKSKAFSVEKLQNLFELTVRTSSAANDNCKEQITCRLDTATVFEQIHRIKTLESQVFQFDFSQKPVLKKDPKYIDFLTLDFKCEFPLNLILNKKSLSKYQALFRLMIWCKFLERQIGSCWMKLQELKEMRAMDMLKPVYKINHRIHTFLKSIVYYFSEEVIEQNWFKLEAGLKKAQNFEEIIQCHDQFLNKCLKEALLTNARLLPLLTSDIGASIYNYISHQKNILQRFQNEFNSIKQNCRKPTKPSEFNEFIKYVHNRLDEEAQENKSNSIDALFSEILTKTLEAFESGLTAFIREISLSTKKEEDHLMRLSEMLDEQKFLTHGGSAYNERRFYV